MGSHWQEVVSAGLVCGAGAAAGLVACTGHDQHNLGGEGWLVTTSNRGKGGGYKTCFITGWDQQYRPG